jgi:hypothetical protein
VDYPADLVVRTILYSQTNGRFELTSRCQRIEVPEGLRGRLSKPADPRLVVAEYDCVPAHPIVDDPRLAARAAELVKNAVEMLLPAKSPAAKSGEQPETRDPYDGPSCPSFCRRTGELRTHMVCSVIAAAAGVVAPAVSAITRAWPLTRSWAYVRGPGRLVPHGVCNRNVSVALS